MCWINYVLFLRIGILEMWNNLQTNNKDNNVIYEENVPNTMKIYKY